MKIDPSSKSNKETKYLELNSQAFYTKKAINKSILLVTN